MPTINPDEVNHYLLQSDKKLTFDATHNGQYLEFINLPSHKAHLIAIMPGGVYSYNNVIEFSLTVEQNCTRVHLNFEVDPSMTSKQGTFTVS